MKYRRTEHFKQVYQTLPAEIREKAKKVFMLFQEDPHHPSLGVKKIQGVAGIWEGRVDRQHRFTFHFEKDEKNGENIVVFRNIDNQDECLKNP